MKSGLYDRPGVSATAWAAAWARRFDDAATKVSKRETGVEATAAASRGGRSDRRSRLVSARVERGRLVPVRARGTGHRGGGMSFEHLEADLDGLADHRRQRALDQRDEPALHAVSHGRVRNPEDEDPLVRRIADRYGFDARQPHLPRGCPRPVHVTTPCSVSTAHCLRPPAPPHALQVDRPQRGPQVWNTDRYLVVRTYTVAARQGRPTSGTWPIAPSIWGSNRRHQRPPGCQIRMGASPGGSHRGQRGDERPIGREANLPTEHPQAGEDPWLPRSACRPAAGGRSCGPDGSRGAGV